MRDSRNRLNFETCPYLKKHAHDLVHWYPWGQPAREASAQLQIPILLFIGSIENSWCQQMQVESFQDEDTSTYMNKHFINVFVCKDSRPDIESIYGEAVLKLTRQHGLPLTVFLTPEFVPFFGGTYFPAQASKSAMQQPVFLKVLETMVQAFRNDRDRCQALADSVQTYLLARSDDFGAESFLRHAFAGTDDQSIQNESALIHDSKAILGLLSLLYSRAKSELFGLRDVVRGGFVEPIKRFHLPRLHLLLNSDDPEKVEFARLTLKSFASSSLFDFIEGGFFREFCDADLNVSHFSKPLNINAERLEIYALASVLLDEKEFLELAVLNYDFIVQRLFSKQKGLYFDGLQFTYLESEESEEFLANEYFGVCREDLAVLFKGEPEADFLIRFSLLYLNFESGSKDSSFRKSHPEKFFPKRPVDLKAFCSETGYSLEQVNKFLEKYRRSALAHRGMQTQPERAPYALLSANAIAARSFLLTGVILGHKEMFESGIQLLNKTLSCFIVDRKIKHIYYSDASEATLSATADDAAFLLDALVWGFILTGDLGFARALRFSVKSIIAEFMLADNADRGTLFFAQKDPLLPSRPLKIDESETGSYLTSIVGALLRLGACSLNPYEKIFDRSWKDDRDRLLRAALGTMGPLAVNLPQACPIFLATVNAQRNHSVLLGCGPTFEKLSSEVRWILKEEKRVPFVFGVLEAATQVVMS